MECYGGLDILMQADRLVVFEDKIREEVLVKYSRRRCMEACGD